MREHSRATGPAGQAPRAPGIAGGSPGFTLVETLVVLAVVGLAAAGVASAISQITQSTTRSKDQMTALRQVQNTGYWVGWDAATAQAIEVGDDPETTTEVEFITMSWTDWAQGDKHHVTYTLEDAGGGLQSLMRRHRVVDQSGTVEKWNVVTRVSDYISSAAFTEHTGTWTLDVQARSGSKTETAAYMVKQRIEI